MKAEPKPVYFNDRKAPRMRKGKFSIQVITRELWTKFRKDFPEYKNKTDNELNSLWLDLADVIKEEIVTNPLGVKLGSYTGELKVQYLPYKLESPNHAVSAELGEEVNHLGLITGGKTPKIKWERRWAVKFNKMLQFFAFDPHRDINRRLNDYLEKHPEQFRVARNTLGGYSIWRQLKDKKL